MNAPRVLLDTSFILPTLGIDTGERIQKGLKKLSESEVEIYYSGFSLLESLWVATRLMEDPDFDINRFRLGLRSIMEGERYGRVSEDAGAFGQALKIYSLGHRDMIDNLLYASSVRLGLKFLTVDEDLKEFVSEKKLNDTLLPPENLSHFY